MTEGGNEMLKSEPESNTLEAHHRLALSCGQKEKLEKRKEK